MSPKRTKVASYIFVYETLLINHLLCLSDPLYAFSCSLSTSRFLKVLLFVSMNLVGSSACTTADTLQKENSLMLHSNSW